MNLQKMIEIYLKYDNMHIFVMINALICINNYITACIDIMLSKGKLDKKMGKEEHNREKEECKWKRVREKRGKGCNIRERKRQSDIERESGNQGEIGLKRERGKRESARERGCER